MDLMAPPYLAHQEMWIQPSNYQATQAIGSKARQSRIPLVQYQSVRDPNGFPAVAVMLPEGVSCHAPLSMEDWDLLISPNQVVWRSTTGRQFPLV